MKKLLSESLYEFRELNEEENIQTLRHELNQHLKINGGKYDSKAKELSKKIKEHPKYKEEDVNENLNNVPIPGGSRDHKSGRIEDFKAKYKDNLDRIEALKKSKAVSSIQNLESAFNSAANAMDALDEIAVNSFETDDPIYQKLMSASNEVEELMDLIDSKLRQ